MSGNATAAAEVKRTMSKPSKGDTVTVWEVVDGRKTYRDDPQPYLLSRVGVCTGKTVRFDPDTRVDMHPFEGPVCGFHRACNIADLTFTEQDAIARWVSACADKVTAAEQALAAARKRAEAKIVRGTP